MYIIASYNVSISPKGKASIESNFRAAKGMTQDIDKAKLFDTFEEAKAAKPPGWIAIKLIHGATLSANKFVVERWIPGKILATYCRTAGGIFVQDCIIATMMNAIEIVDCGLTEEARRSPFAVEFSKLCGRS